MTDIIGIEHWANPPQCFVRVYLGAKQVGKRLYFRKSFRPDTLFCQYTAGKLPPNYPVPAIRGWVEILPMAVFYYELVGDKNELIVYLAQRWPNENGIWG